MPPLPHRPHTVASIDHSSLAHNLTQVRHCLTGPCEILAVVKANAYGHGSLEIVEALRQLGVMRFGVSTLDEALTLRRQGVQTPILVMGALTTAQMPEVVAQRLTPVLYEAGMLPAFARAVSDEHAPYPVHLKIETGMGRLGLLPEEVGAVLSSLPPKAALRIEGLMTHLADADSKDPSYTDYQLERFRVALAQARQAGVNMPVAHTANSAGILAHPSSHFSLVRPGIMLYGYHTLALPRAETVLKPVLTWSTTIMQIRQIPKGGSVSYNRTFVASRPSRVAVLPVGYADGYNRALSNRGVVLVHGQRAPVVGRVCMDMTMVDVTDIPAATAGDVVVLIGQQGRETITANDLASLSGTIPYEVLCAIGPRIPRIHCSDEPQRATV